MAGDRRHSAADVESEYEDLPIEGAELTHRALNELLVGFHTKVRVVDGAEVRMSSYLPPVGRPVGGAEPRSAFDSDFGMATATQSRVAHLVKESREQMERQDRELLADAGPVEFVQES